MGMKWISVEDRLPASETPVLVWFKNKEVRVASLEWEFPSYEDNYLAYRYWDCPYNDGQDWEWFDITHWMPLPEPPEEGE